MTVCGLTISNDSFQESSRSVRIPMNNLLDGLNLSCGDERATISSCLLRNRISRYPWNLNMGAPEEGGRPFPRRYDSNTSIVQLLKPRSLGQMGSNAIKIVSIWRLPTRPPQDFQPHVFFLQQNQTTKSDLQDLTFAATCVIFARSNIGLHAVDMAAPARLSFPYKT